MKTEQQTNRVIQEEESVFLEVSEKKKVHMNMCLILNGYWDTAVWIYSYKSIVIGNRER